MILLDTSVVSFLFNGDTRSDFYLPYMTGQRTLVSFQAVEEMWHGAYRVRWGARRKNELSRHLEQYDVVWPDEETVDISANLRVERERAGHRLNTADAWIAATAIRLSCPLAADDGDFDGIASLNLIRAPRP